jgi:hypothetical protein
MLPLRQVRRLPQQGKAKPLTADRNRMNARWGKGKRAEFSAHLWPWLLGTLPSGRFIALALGVNANRGWKLIVQKSFPHQRGKLV